MNAAARPLIYLAGPDVFEPDAAARFQQLEGLCASRGLQGLRPSDDNVPALRSAAASTPYAIAERICHDNIERLKRSAAVLANMVPFRGRFEPDSGTVFEVGMAVALGKPVAVYLPQADADMASRIRAQCGVQPGTDASELCFDAEFGMMIEDFGLPLNLMIACSASIHASPEAALDQLARRLAGSVDGPSGPL
jgi:nucleoside 2-deoxyribosyltransferase